MPIPIVTSGVEQPGPFSCLWVDSCEVGAFVMIVCDAGQRKIAWNRFASMLQSKYMVDLERQTNNSLRHLTLLAT
jgi:hypothetical protein